MNTENEKEEEPISVEEPIETNDFDALITKNFNNMNGVHLVKTGPHQRSREVQDDKKIEDREDNSSEEYPSVKSLKKRHLSSEP